MIDSKLAQALSIPTSMRDATHLLHIVPVGNDTVLDRVLEGQDTTLGLSLVTYVRVLLAVGNKQENT
jgi:hypothetical protein